MSATIDESIIELIGELEDNRTRVMVAGDADALADILSDELYYGHSGGYWDTKDGFMQKFRAGVYAYRSLMTNVERAVWLGNDAISLHGTVRLAVRLYGVEKQMHSIYLAVWRLENGSWRFLAHQTALQPVH